MEKAKHCDECRFFRSLIPISRTDLLCEKGHRPRFYKPKTTLSPDWGYKRRCDDFMLDNNRV